MTNLDLSGTHPSHLRHQEDLVAFLSEARQVQRLSLETPLQPWLVPVFASFPDLRSLSVTCSCEELIAVGRILPSPLDFVFIDCTSNAAKFVSALSTIFDLPSFHLLSRMLLGEAHSRGQIMAVTGADALMARLKTRGVKVDFDDPSESVSESDAGNSDDSDEGSA